MRKTFVFIAGIAAGVFLARQIEANPETKQALNQTGKKIKTFANAVSEGYREQEAKASKVAKPRSAK
jgi:outer membrane lipoprotein-sorting protein